MYIGVFNIHVIQCKYNNVLYLIQIDTEASIKDR